MTTLFERLQLMVERASESCSPYVAVMKTTVENSGWHREANVWVHTQMVVSEFLKIWTVENSLDGNGINLVPDERAMFCAGVAALFHDFGKPDAEEEKTSEAGVIYRRYAGHEAVSGAVFREVANSPTQWAELFGDVENDLTPMEKVGITLMIQHHLPYQYKPQMAGEVVLACADMLETDEVPFFSLLRADARGRISDDHATKLKNVEVWIDAAEEHYHSVKEKRGTMLETPEAGVAYILVGPSGAGKGTYIKDVLNVGREHVYSMDDLRMQHYADPNDTNPLTAYANAWKAAVEDETNFKQLCTKRVHELCKSKAKVIVGSDNMNLSKKSRREFAGAAKQAGRAVVAIVFVSVSLEELQARGEARGDRGIPSGRLKNMFHCMRVPAYDEVDLIAAV